jgi:FtsZ-binding cell division protein ZapB
MVPASGQVLSYNGASWAPSTISTGLTLPFNASSNYATTPFSINNTGTSPYTIAGVSNSGFGIYGSTGAIIGAGVFGLGTGTNLSIGVLGQTGENSYPLVPGNTGVLGQSDVHLAVAGISLTGTGGYFSSETGLALHTIGNVKMTGIGEAAGRVLTSDATGLATWQDPTELTLPYSQTIANIGYAFSVTNTTGSAIEGIATSTSNTTNGVRGSSSSSANGSSGIYGSNSALSGLTQGVYGESNSVSGSGVWGYNGAETGYTKGVFGTSSSSQGYGIYGYNNASTGTTYGVYGGTLSPTGYGVYGEAFRFGVYGKASVYGIVGEADAEYGMGVCGMATSSSGMNYGVIGESFSTSGFGVYGHNAASTGVTFGLYGISESPDGYGVFGYASKYGVYGSSSNNGIYGEASSGDGNGVYGLATSSSGLTHGVWGESASTSGVGVYGNSSALSGFTYGVIGVANSPDGGGIFGNGQRFGVFGQSSLYGIYGEAHSQNGRGVFGIATSTSGNTYGVRGESSSSSGYGVYGMTSASSGSTIGVYGESFSPSGYGVYGSAPRYGVYGYCASVDGYAGYFSGRLTVTDKVGIGTNAPTSQLDIDGREFASEIHIVTSGSGRSSTDGLKIGYNGYGYLWNNENTDLAFATNGNERFTIKSNGNIGIGTITPNYLLDVTGAININRGISSGIALYCNGWEAIWYNGTYFSWGNGGTYNYFQDEVTIGTSASPGYALVVNGTAAKTGGGSWSTLSDIRLKNLSVSYDKGLKEIMALQPVKFFYKEGNPRELASDEEQIGFVAQDVQKVFPEAVTEAKDGYLDFNIHAINVAVVNAIKELKTENDQLKIENDQLKAENELLKSENEQIDSRLTNIEKIIGVSALK